MFCGPFKGKTVRATPEVGRPKVADPEVGFPAGGPLVLYAKGPEADAMHLEANVINCKLGYILYENNVCI